MRPKKRGSKPIRRFRDPVTEIVLKGTALTAWANRRGITVATASEELHRHLARFVAKPLKLTLPEDSYIILADAFWFTFGKQDYTMFLDLLKPVTESKAYFLDPVLLPGGESYENWVYVLSQIPLGLKEQVKAFVSEGFGASWTIALEQGWIHQRSHFHLLAYLQVRRGREKKVIFGKSVREAIYKRVIKLLRVKSKTQVLKFSGDLKLLAKQPDSPKSLQLTVAEVLRTLSEFRAYLYHPELHLPITTRSVETMGRLIGKRAGTVRTIRLCNSGSLP